MILNFLIERRKKGFQKTTSVLCPGNERLPHFNHLEIEQISEQILANFPQRERSSVDRWNFWASFLPVWLIRFLYILQVRGWIQAKALRLTSTLTYFVYYGNFNGESFKGITPIEEMGIKLESYPTMDVTK